MSRSRRVLTLVMVLAAVPGFSNSTEEWESFFRQNLGLVQRNYFTYLGSDFNALAATIVLKIKERTLRLQTLESALRAVTTELEAGGDLDGKRLREAALMSRDAELLTKQVRDDLFQLHRLAEIRANACSPARLDPLSSEFDAAGIVNTKEILQSINGSIATLNRDNPDNPSFSIHLSVGTSGFNMGQADYSKGYASSRWQDAVIGASTALGATIGSFVPVIGTTIGGAIGFAISTLIVGIICGGDTPADRMNHELNDQVPRIMTALDHLRGPASRKMLGENCDAIFSTASSKEYTDKLRIAAESSASGAEARYATIVEMTKRIEARYQAALQTLARDSLRNFSRNFERSFEEFLAEKRELSMEAKGFVAREVKPRAIVVLGKQAGAVEKAAAAQVLWDRLIEGEARYTTDDAFGFDRTVGPERNNGAGLGYWSGASRAVTNLLSGRL